MRRAALVLQAGGAELVLHLRSRDPAGELFSLAVQLAEAAEAAGAHLAVNDRVDVALGAGIGWVHLGSGSLPGRDARELLERAGARPTVLGRSVHSRDELRDPEDMDYFVAGNLHETASHPGREARGTDWLASLTAAAERPVLAIGGITPERVAGAVRAGAHGVAVLSGIWESGAPGDAVSRYLEALRATSRTQT